VSICKGNCQEPQPHLMTVKPKASQSADGICCGPWYIYQILPVFMQDYQLHFHTRSSACCKGTSARFLTFPLYSSTLLYSPLLSHTHPCSYVHSPTLCTITRCQVLNADDSQTSKMSTTTVVGFLPLPSALTSEALDELWTHWDRST
jgi:hypothetical protein